jgi:hypothetical protein
LTKLLWTPGIELLDSLVSEAGKCSLIAHVALCATLATWRVRSPFANFAIG